MRAKKLFAIVAAALTFATMSVVAPQEADAAPGTCKCNQGCHANPGQCLNGAACNFGYAPSCGFRDADAGADCPKSDYISCNGTCVCSPIPGFCETIGGAEFCDAGPPDTGLPDTEKPDTEMPDTEMPDTRDTMPPPDTFVPPDTEPPPDTFVPPDTRDTAPPDTEQPDTRDTEPLPDTMDTMPVDSCVPLVCPDGFKTYIVPGNCDPYCAQPCGTGEFKCFGGLVCNTDNFCVPKGPGDGGTSCISSGCPDCQKCNLTDGICFADPTRCADGGAGDGGGTTDGGDPDGAPVTDTAGGGDGTVGDDTGGAGADGTIGDDTGGSGTDGGLDNDGSVNPGDPTADPGTEGGCGCSVPGNNAENTLAALTAAAALAMVFARRRKK